MSTIVAAIFLVVAGFQARAPLCSAGGLSPARSRLTPPCPCAEANPLRGGPQSLVPTLEAAPCRPRWIAVAAVLRRRTFPSSRPRFRSWVSLAVAQALLPVRLCKFAETKRILLEEITVLANL